MYVEINFIIYMLCNIVIWCKILLVTLIINVRIYITLYQYICLSYLIKHKNKIIIIGHNNDDHVMIVLVICLCSNFYPDDIIQRHVSILYVNITLFLKLNVCMLTKLFNEMNIYYKFFVINNCYEMFS